MKTILVVGREWKFRALLRAQLREEGYQALGFETLHDAESEAAAALVFDTTDAPADWQPALQRLAAQLPVLIVAGAQEEVQVPGARVLRRPLHLRDILAALRDLTSA